MGGQSEVYFDHGLDGGLDAGGFGEMAEEGKKIWAEGNDSTLQKGEDMIGK